MGAMKRLAAALLLVLAAALPAAAHNAPFSYLDLRLAPDHLEGTLVLHVDDLAHDLGLPAEQFLDAAVVRMQRDRIVGVVTPRLAIGGDQPLPITWLDAAPDPDRHAVVLSLRSDAAPPGRLTIAAPLFAYDAAHQTFVNVYEGGELRHQFVIAASSAVPVVYYTNSRQGIGAVVRTFIPAGIRHILIGPDHVLFLIALLLPGGGWKKVVLIATAFTLGHSITLTLAALGLLMPPPSLIEPAIALSIVYAGADNLTRGGGRDVRPWIALLFGLVHGFGFAGVLREFGLPREALGWSLFSFNAGVELGQLALIVPCSLALALVWSHRSSLAARITQLGSGIVIAAGIYWFIERVFFVA
jgi:hypothetical protein